jgi:hypothetical protein
MTKAATRSRINMIDNLFFINLPPVFSSIVSCDQASGATEKSMRQRMDPIAWPARCLTLALSINPPFALSDSSKLLLW